MDAGQREMPEREPHVPGKLALDLFDRMERLPGVRAFVVAVFDDQVALAAKVNGRYPIPVIYRPASHS